MMEREIEVKLLANSTELLAEIEKRTMLAGVPLTPGEARIQEDTYFDTERFHLLRGGFSLRHRLRGGKKKATLKSIPGHSERTLLRDRTEIEEPMDSVAGTMNAGGRIEDVIGEILDGRPVQPVVRIHTERQTFLLGPELAGGAILCADRSRVYSGDGTEPVAGFLEVEVEDAGGGRDLLQRAGHELMDEYGLRPSSLSKFERGLSSLGLLDQARGEGGAP